MEGVVDLLQAGGRKAWPDHFVLHKGDETGARPAIDRMWDVFVKKPRVMTWSARRSIPTQSCTPRSSWSIVEMLVGSANFTFHGLESNLELGLRVRGPRHRPLLTLTT